MSAISCILVTRDGAQTWKAVQSRSHDGERVKPMVPCGVAPAADRLPAAQELPLPTPAAGGWPRRPAPADLRLRRSRPSSRASSGPAAATARSTTRWTAARPGTTSRNFTDLPANVNFVTVEGAAQRRQYGLCARERRLRPWPRRARRRRPNGTTSIARTTAARPGRDRQRPADRRTHRQLRCTSFAKIPNRKGCSSPAPRRPSTFHSTTAITGSRCGSICRARRFATWCFTPTIT